MENITLTNKQKITLYTTDEVSKMFTISVSWLEKNRCGAHRYQIPFTKLIGGSVRYEHQELVALVGKRTLELLTSKEVAELLSKSEEWLKNNRKSKNPIPFLRLGRLIRYHPDDVRQWLDKNKKLH